MHLLAILKLFGAECNQGTLKQLRENLGMDKGSISNYVDHGIQPILSLHDQVFFWSSEKEWLEISG
jgi:hypothetical protein